MPNLQRVDGAVVFRNLVAPSYSQVIAYKDGKIGHVVVYSNEVIIINAHGNANGRFQSSVLHLALLVVAARLLKLPVYIITCSPRQMKAKHKFLSKYILGDSNGIVDTFLGIDKVTDDDRAHIEYAVVGETQLNLDSIVEKLRSEGSQT